MKLILRTTLALSLLAVTLMVTACNTTKGAGQDLQNAGRGIENSADRHGAD